MPESNVANYKIYLMYDNNNVVTKFIFKFKFIISCI